MKKLALVFIVLAVIVAIIETWLANIKKNAGISVANPPVTGLQLSPSSFKGTVNLLVNNPTNVDFILTSVQGTISAVAGGQTLGNFIAPLNTTIKSGQNPVPLNVAVSGINAALVLVGANNICIAGTATIKKGFINIPIPFSDNFTISDIVNPNSSKLSSIP